MDPKKETVTLEELTVTNMYEIHALINVLESKGIITKQELINEVDKLHKERLKKLN